ncbi:uncharacterized protein VP01_1756g3 [Puccinia sorghi]|uniref:DH domain-containing protein n=1 Tax=Puccinia sorghi TaxID=27349 RepID=A0A0L6VF00_9BASI|nr:uncharacterized protein VP01_1756g3 [Puccinia sorghi]
MTHTYKVFGCSKDEQRRRGMGGGKAEIHPTQSILPPPFDIANLINVGHPRADHWSVPLQPSSLQRRASIATSSLSRAPPDQQGPASLPLESETLSLPYKHRQAPASPRARFAENPIIGPTRESSNTRLSRRKSALKSRSPSQLMVPASKAPTVNLGTTTHVSPSSSGSSAVQKLASSSTAPSLVVPSSSSKRARATSMIADHDSLWPNPYLYPQDAIHPSGQKNIYHHNLAELDQFESRQRAHSMSDFTTPEPLPQRQPDHQSQQTTALTSNIHQFAGYVIDQHDRPHRRLSHQTQGLEAPALMLRDCDSLEFSDHSRPVSTHSSSATSSFSSTLTPPPDSLCVHVHDYRAGQLAPEGTTKHDRKLEENFLASAASSASSLIKNHYYYSDHLGTGVDPDQLISPLERLSSLGPVRPTIKARKRSGTVLPPKQPDLVLHPSPDTSCFVLPSNFPPATIHIKPPARPPRSHRRAPPAINTQPNLPLAKASNSHMTKIEPSPKSLPSISKPPTERPVLINDSGRSNAAPVAAVVGLTSKAGPKSSPKTAHAEVPERRRPGTPPALPRTGKAASRAKKMGSPAERSTSSDAGDDFESASEGEDHFWAPAQGLRSHAPKPPDAPKHALAEKAPNHVPILDPGLLVSPRQRVSIIGAFPRSGSFPDSLLSTESSSLSLRDTAHASKDASDQSPRFPACPDSDKKSGLGASYQPLTPWKASVTRSSDLGPAAPHRVAITPPKSPLTHFSLSRNSSLEGLAALRHSNSISPRSPLKKTSPRSLHFRQLSKILNFCAKDAVGLEDDTNSGNGPSSPPSPAQPNVMHTPPPVGVPCSTWKNSMSQSAYDNLLRMYGAVEMRRQELIWELCETESAFATGLRQVISTFASPLRTPEGAWISGVPPEVARQLDWLEDIANLHSQMAFQARNCCQYQTEALGLVVHISEVFLELSPKLQLYQPYLVRFRSVTAAIDSMVADLNSDFGEFVRMQSSLPECGRMSMTSFLLKPIQRLMKYPLFYKQLCEVTPPAHPDYEATVCLLSATDSVIRVLQEVKEREDEYEKLQEMEGRIKGLPSGFKLARRDRRLLAQGLMKRVQLPPARGEGSDSPGSNNSKYNLPWTTTHGARPESRNAGWSPLPWSGHSSENMSSSPSRSSYRSQWSHHSGSSSGESSGAPGALLVDSTRKLSPQRYSSASANRENEPPGNLLPRASKPLYSWGPPPRSSLAVDEEHYLRPRPALPLRAQSDEQQQQQQRQQRGLDRRKSLPVGRPSISARKPKETPLHVFVFSDLVLLATKHSDGVRLIRSATTKLHRKKKEPQSCYYSLVDQVGLSTLLSVEDLSGQLDYAHLLKLEMEPLMGVEGGVRRESILLSLPERGGKKEEEEGQKWLMALREGMRGGGMMGSLEEEEEEEWGVPEPSSSTFLALPSHLHERLERHWWARRHHRVASRMRPNHTHLEHHLLNQIKTSGLGLDLAF